MAKSKGGISRRTVVAALSVSACKGLVTDLPDGGAAQPDAGLGPNPMGDAGTTDAGPGPQIPSGKYMFQQALLFQRAHARSLTHRYTNSLGQQVTVADNVATFDGSTSSGSAWAGSTPELLCAASRRPWAHPGGDWRDARDTPQGLVPFASSTPLGMGASGVVRIDVTSAVRWMFEHQHWCAFFIQVRGSAGTQLTGVLNPDGQAPSLTFTDAAARTERLDCWYTASLRNSTAYTNAQEDVIDVGPGTPAVLEFFRRGTPDVRVTTVGVAPQIATLEVRHGAVTAADLRFDVYVVDPPLPATLNPLPGLAATYPLDAGLMANGSVAAALRITDSDTNADVLDEARSGTAADPWVPTSVPYGRRSEATMDPYLFTATPGQGDFAAVPAPTDAQRAALFPRRVQSARGTKLVGNASRKKADTAQDAIRVVHGDDALAKSRGFTPLAPGLGALEMMYGGGSVLNGQATFQSQTGSNNIDLDLWFREQHIGRVIDGYMRVYVLLGDGWDPTSDDESFQFYAPNLDAASLGKYPEQLGVDPAKATWRRLDRTGKFPGGIQQQTSGHTVMKSYVDPTRMTGDAQANVLAGGAYSSSSGIHGYQGRWLFWQGYGHAGTPGPAVGGLALGVELYDFNGGGGITIPSQNPVGGWDSTSRSFATHIGGLGFLYPRRWYCVEMRWHMNTVKPYQLPPVGTHWLEGGHNVDGFIEWWVDGLPAAKTPLFAHRSSAAIVDWALQNAANQPYDTVAGSPDRLRGISNVPPELFMGAASAVFNAYYGGRTFNESNKFVYLNGIVCSNGAYIGPMAGVTRENGGLGS
jgi:hypothetical protein